MPSHVIVIGAGVVGLSTAVQLQEMLPSCKVSIVADKFGSQTNSDGAAGMFQPTYEKTPGVPDHLLKQWLQTSWEHYDCLAHSEQAKEAGVQILSGYQFFTKEITAWLPHHNTDGRMQQISAISDDKFIDQCDAVVICTGFGSKKLLQDTAIHAIRGHIIRVQAPWIKQFIHCSDMTQGGFTFYAYPGAESVAIGGTRHLDDEDLTVRQEEHDRIWSRACEVLPSLKDAKILHDWVGHRPFRNPLRLVKDIYKSEGKELRVVYNYGHGAEGVSLSWGTAKHAAELVMEQLGAKCSKL